jgi:CTP synthase (UTP-ammonia lyase)
MVPDEKASAAKSPIRIGLIGDHDPTVTAHRAIPRALTLAAGEIGQDLAAEWVHTSTIPNPPDRVLTHFDGVWCVPASPYASTDGALRAIRYARERGIPFLGTCGGFQHAVLELARTVLGRAGAAHAEIQPGADDVVVTPLRCALVEQTGTVRLVEGSRAASLCAGGELREEYHCSYGLNPDYEAALERVGLRITGRDPSGEARVVELVGHPFYLATLFQPERAALRGERHPLVRGFVAAAAAPSPRTREDEWRTSATPSGNSSSPVR